MKLKLIYIITAIMLLSGTGAKAKTGIFSFGLGAGFSYVPGEYSQQIENSYTVSVFSIPYSYQWFYIDVDFSFSTYPLVDSPRSLYSPFKLALGPGIIFPVFEYMNIFFSVDFLSVIVNLKTYELKTNETVYKPGISIKTGLIFPVYKGLRLRVTTELTYYDISSKAFLNLNFYGGVAYDFNYYKREVEEKQKKKKLMTQRAETEEKAALYKIIEQADAHYDRKNIKTAYRLYKKILTINPEHKKSLERTKKISEWLNVLKQAKALENNKPFSALRLYIEIESQVPEAKKSLALLRKKMRNNIAPLLKKAVAAYNKKRYKVSIYYFRQVSYIDPENNTVKIYLPRAIKRYNIIKKFK